MIKKYNTEIVLIVLTLFILEGIIQTTFYEYSTSWQFYSGAALTVLFWILYFLKISRLKTIIGIGLLLGFMNLIEFTYYHLTFALSWTPPGHVFTSIGFQPFIFLTLMFFILTNSKRVGELVRSFTARSNEEIKASENHLIQKFKIKLESENVEKLQSIIENPNNYQKEYVIAAQELLNKNK